jgi:hypothetical protein
MSRPQRGERRAHDPGLGDRMTNSLLGNLHRIAPPHGPFRAAATWLAFVALLGNALLPAAFSIVVLKEPGRGISRVGLCGQWPGDAPDKTKTGLLVQHCPLCSLPAASLPRPLTILGPGDVAGESQLQILTTVLVAPIRHGRMQARAPPSAA